jgi:hypothetical protein
MQSMLHRKAIFLFFYWFSNQYFRGLKIEVDNSLIKKIMNPKKGS